MTILECMSNILEKLKNNESKNNKLSFSEERLPIIKEETDYLNAVMGFSPVQSVLMSVLIQKSADDKTTIEEVADYLGMNYIKFLTYDMELKGLWDRWLIRRRASEIRVPHEVIDKFRENEPYQKPDTSNLSTRKIINRMDTLFNMVKENTMSFGQLMKEMDEIVHNNQDTSIGRAVKKYLAVNDKYVYDIKERFMFFLLIHLYDNCNDDRVEMDDVYTYCPNYKIYEELEELYKNEELKLQKEGIIEHVRSDGFLEEEFFHIKDEIKGEILEDKGGLHQTIAGNCDINPEDIPEKELFYNDSEKDMVATLEGMLSKEKLGTIYDSLKAKGLRTGFTCLFYGSPGTGKTETVYQLAKRTGRKIIVADVSKLKDCYLGETEKNVKRLFTRYRLACRSDEPTPILLFNECDAIFGVRNEGARRSVDKTENAVQNIILQEMENLSGILIATTNLTGSLDKAFERRFLFKIKFDKPSLNVKGKIWRSMIPDLTPDEASELAKEFDFSGGQIENIVRKREIQSILWGENPDFKSIRKYCGEEIIQKGCSRGKRIGF